MEREATLDELLAEPAVIALMDRDGVDPEAVRRLITDLRDRRGYFFRDGRSMRCSSGSSRASSIRS